MVEGGVLKLDVDIKDGVLLKWDFELFICFGIRKVCRFYVYVILLNFCLVD